MDPLNKIDYRDKNSDCTATDLEPKEQCANIKKSAVPGQCDYFAWNGVCLYPFIKSAGVKNG